MALSTPEWTDLGNQRNLNRIKYTEGKYDAAFNQGGATLKQMNQETAEDARTLGWAAQKLALKSTDPAEKKEKYEIAASCGKEMLDLATELDTISSGFNLLLLVPEEILMERLGPEQSIKNLFEQGKEIFLKSEMDETKIKYMIRGMINSIVNIYKLKEPLTAIKYAEEGLELTEDKEEDPKGFAHLKNNMGDCYFNLREEETDFQKRQSFADLALQHWDEAIDNYPPKEVEHINRATEKRNKLQAEINKITKKE